jgi:hypothetical protein
MNSILLPGQEPLVSDSYKFIYQPLTKVGCKTIKSWMIILEELKQYEFDSSNPEHQQQIIELYTEYTKYHYDKSNKFHIHNACNQKFGMYTNNKNNSNYDDYFKFVFVRNPWDRIASCYIDKATQQTPYFRTQHLLKWMLSNTTFEEAQVYFTENNTRFTFEGFVEAVSRVIKDEVVELYDPHWLPQVYVMDYFVKDFDFVGKIENIDEDFKTIQSKLNLPTTPTSTSNVDMVINSKGLHSETKKTRGKYDHFYESNPHLVEKVNTMYQEDINRLSYKF